MNLTHLKNIIKYKRTTIRFLILLATCSNIIHSSDIDSKDTDDINNQPIKSVNILTFGYKLSGVYDRILYGFRHRHVNKKNSKLKNYFTDQINCMHYLKYSNTIQSELNQKNYNLVLFNANLGYLEIDNIVNIIKNIFNNGIKADNKLPQFVVMYDLQRDYTLDLIQLNLPIFLNGDPKTFNKIFTLLKNSVLQF